MMRWPTDIASTISRQAIVGLIIALALGMIPLTLFLVKQELIALSGDTVALEAADIADKLDIVLAERLGDIRAFAQSPFLTRGDRPQMLAYLQDLHRIYPIYLRLSLVDRSGQVLASTEPDAEPSTLVSPTSLEATLRGDHPHVDLIQSPDRAAGTLRSVRFSATVLGLDHEPRGVVISEIDQHTFRRFVTQTTQRGQLFPVNPAIKEFLVLDQTGRALLSSADSPEEPPDGESPSARRPPLLTTASPASSRKSTDRTGETRSQDSPAWRGFRSSLSCNGRFWSVSTGPKSCSPSGRCSGNSSASAASA